MRTTPLLLLALLATGAGPARAGDDGVYGPAAPPDSAFVRVFNATTRADLEARVGNESLGEIPAFGASAFVFLPEGTHTVAAGDVTQPVKLARGRYYTAVVGGAGVRLLENERYANRLKALLLVYNLVDGTTLSLRTAEGRDVVGGVAVNAFGAREVNAVKARLALFDGSRKIADVGPVNLERGRAFSLFVAGPRERPVTTWVVN